MPAFIAELDRVMRDADLRSAGLSVARFTFDASFDNRAINDAARMIGKLKRAVDFACRDDDGTILVAFAETDIRRAQAVTRRLSNVLKHTMVLPENLARAGNAARHPHPPQAGRYSGEPSVPRDDPGGCGGIAAGLT